ncbi:MAG TPA: hypothetical protein VFE56_12660 [Candidatus Binataceae bacterium]|nr:hypothetical protein [Candidatus Binataceae bacterium]
MAKMYLLFRKKAAAPAWGGYAHLASATTNKPAWITAGVRSIPDIVVKQTNELMLSMA